MSRNRPPRKLACFGADSPTQALTSAEGTELPSQKFRKTVIRCGQYVHPHKGWKLTVDENRMQRWVKTFDRMNSGGVQVPMVKDHTVTADTTLGFADRLFVADEGHGKELVAEFTAIGREAIECVQRIRNVSICVEEDVRDGLGRAYGEAITHIGFTPVPVVPGQSDIRIAASLGQGDEAIPMCFLMADNPEPDMKGRPMDLKAIAEILGHQGELTEAGLPEAVKAALDAQKATNGTLTTQVTDLTAAVETLKKELEAAKGGAKAEASLSPDALEDSAEAVADRLHAVALKLGLTPDAESKLCAVLTGPAANRNVFMLSRTDTPNDKGRRPVRAMAIIDALDGIDPKTLIQTGSKTGTQARCFSFGDDSSETKRLQQEIEARSKAVYQPA